MNNIVAILSNTYRDLLSKKALYFLVFIVLVISLIFGAQIFFFFSREAITDTDAMIAQKADILGQVLSFWASMSILIGIIYAAGAVKNEMKEKTILGVLSKPIARWEFLIGKYLGVLFFFGAFYLVGVILCVGLMLYWDVEFTLLFLTGIIHQFIEMSVYTTMSFIICLFAPPVAGGGLAFMIWSFSSQFEGLMQSSYDWISIIGTALYYLSPAVISDNITRNGLLNNVIDPEFGLYWSVIAENFFYAAIIFYIGVILFKRKDIVLT